MKRPAKKHTYDDTLLVTVLILVLVGLILLTSTSAYNGRVKFHDSYYYLKKQGLATVLGMAGMLWIARIDYHRWIPLAVPGYLAAIGLSIAVMAFGKEYNGSKRWLSLGPFSFQPSEFAKVAVILFLAWLINRNVKKISKLRIMSADPLCIQRFHKSCIDQTTLIPCCLKILTHLFCKERHMSDKHYRDLTLFI